MSVEATMRDALRMAESHWKRKNGPKYKPREAGFKVMSDGRKEWTGPKSYKLGDFYLQPWEYVDLLHYMAACKFTRGPTMFLHYLIDQHVPKVAQRPVTAGLPRGLTKEQRQMIIDARDDGRIWSRKREEMAGDDEDKPKPITAAGALLRKRAGSARPRTDAEKVSAAVAARRPKQKQAGRLRRDPAPIQVRFVSR